MDAAWLRGIFPPIPTAFAADGRLQPPPAGFLELLRDSGLQGVVALGSNGEAAHLTEAERLQWIRLVRQALPSPLRLVAGTGAESTLATLQRTRAAAAEGAEAALVIAPSYFRRQLTVETLRAHYQAVAEASPIPILIYNVPVHMGYDLGAEWIVQLTGHPNIAGLKDSSGDIARLPRLRRQLGPDFILLAGAGEKMVDALDAGADGAIAALANLAPGASAGIRTAWLERRVDLARQLQTTIAPLGEALTAGYGVPGLKAGLRLQGYDHGDPRKPLPPLGASELAALRHLLEDAKLMPRALAS
jgi:4-hydroxy-2-oxoglutarate aldolase